MRVQGDGFSRHGHVWQPSRSHLVVPELGRTHVLPTSGLGRLGCDLPLRASDRGWKSLGYVDGSFAGRLSDG
eukprot:398639-Rhodomonas_salina.1